MKPTILIVDDEPDVRVSLGMLLRLEDFEVLMAEHGPAALRMIDGRPPDLVVLDFMMPYMNGQELAKALKAAPATAHVPIIMSSAVKPREQAAWDAFLRKPVAFAELLSTIRKLLPLR